MSKHTLGSLVISAALCAGLVEGGFQTADRPGPVEALFTRASEAWDTGDYVRALQDFDTVLESPEAGRFFERIALKTGELYKVVQIAPDGRNLHFSPDGRYASFDTGSGAGRVMHILDAERGFKELAEVKGTGGVFSPSGGRLAFLRVEDSPRIRALRKEIEAAAASGSGEYPARRELQRRLALFEAEASRIVLRDIASGSETVLLGEGRPKGEPAFSADGLAVYFTGPAESGEDSSDIYSVPAGPGAGGSRPRALTSGPGFKVRPVVVPGGKTLIYSLTSRNPYPRPAEPPLQAGARVAETPGRPAPPERPSASGPAGSAKFVILNLDDGSARTIEGRLAAVSADGATAAFIGRQGAENTLNLLALEAGAAPTVLKKTSEAIGPAAFSPDGSTLAFEMTWTRNSEIFLIGADGRNEVRLTRDIQNDRSPRFLSPGRVLVVRGESRHSRSYLYDTDTLSGTRLFHNNTVRTIAPEYEWAGDPSGGRILIAADRDGDTMSPAVGVYLLDLTKTVDLEALRARVRSCLRSEEELRALGQAMFRPVAEAVRSVTARVSTSRLYGYQKALFDFDSKHVTQPGNLKASEYIFKTLESFGFTPEYQWVPGRPNKTANVVAVLKGTENPDLYCLLSSHYDSNRRSPGADDNSSATAVLLETARLLAGEPLPSSVIFAAFTGEEAGFWGSREFVRLAGDNHLEVVAALNNDMIGWTNDNRLDDTIRYSNRGIRDVLHAAAFGFSRLITYDSRYIKSTDSVPLYEAWGDIIGGLGSYPVVSSPYYHQPTDLLETVNQQLVTEAARSCAAAVMLLASSPSPVRGLKVVAGGAGAAGEVSLEWTPNPEKAVAGYLVTWSSAGNGGRGERSARRVRAPRVRLAGLKLGPGERCEVAVRAVDARGLESWDETRIVVTGGAKAGN